MVYISFFAGVNYNAQEGGNSYTYEIFGFLLIIFLCVLERKSQIWLSNKFGYVGSTYENFKGKIILKNYESNPKLQDTFENQLAIRDLGIIQEVEEESRNTFSKAEDLMKKSKDDESEGDESPESQHENKPSLQEIYEKDKKKNVMKLLQMEYML